MNSLFVRQPVDHVHEIAGCIAFARGCKDRVEVRRGIQHIEQRPKTKTASCVLFQPQIDQHLLYPGVERGGRNLGQLVLPEIAADLVGKVHGP